MSIESVFDLDACQILQNCAGGVLVIYKSICMELETKLKSNIQVAISAVTGTARTKMHEAYPEILILREAF